MRQAVVEPVSTLKKKYLPREECLTPSSSERPGFAFDD
jgi:hypothetical protein